MSGSVRNMFKDLILRKKQLAVKFNVKKKRIKFVLARCAEFVLIFVQNWKNETRAIFWGYIGRHVVIKKDGNAKNRRGQRKSAGVNIWIR